MNSPSRWCLGLALCAAMLSPQPARAQATVSAEAGLGGYYKPRHWLPVRLTLTNQGSPARVGASARFRTGREGGQVAVLPEQQLPGGTNKAHTLYLEPDTTYGAQQLAVDYTLDGRPQNPVMPQLSFVSDGEWLVVGVGESPVSIKSLAADQMEPNSRTRAIGGYGGQPNQKMRIHVSVMQPGQVPDRWHGLTAADMVVLGDVGERALTPEQAAALRQYAVSGGTLVVSGGVNWRRLASEYYQELLPVRVVGSHTVSGAPYMGFAGGAPIRGSFAAATGEPKPGATVDVKDAAGRPLVVSRRLGAGQVVFLAFDPELPPFRDWRHSSIFWKKLLQDGATAPPGLVQTIAASDDDESYAYGPQFSGGQARLADAPFAISQLDIPAFYVVALFLLAYIICLVPVNYYLLKSRDKKEYAWLTTPLIVLVFSVGAYMIGYGYKGGRTLLAKVAVVEARAGESTGATIAYAGLFSPRKTTYDIQLVADGSPVDAGSTLLSEPGHREDEASLRLLQGDTVQVADLNVDMWAMRVVKAEGMTNLDRGVTVQWSGAPGQSGGTIQNGTPHTLTDCHLVSGGNLVRLPDLPPGGSAQFDGTLLKGTGGSGVLPAGLTEQVAGSREVQRMKRAVLHPLTSTAHAARGGAPATNGPLLVAWLKVPVARLLVDGAEPREQAATLVVVHLDPKR